MNDCSIEKCPSNEELIKQFIDDSKHFTSQTDILVLWWKYVNQHSHGHYDFLYLMNKSARGRIDRLPREHLKSARRSFDKDNHYRHRYTESEFCFLHNYELSQKTYLVKHHIIPLKSWGTNRPINIITLCSRCHAYYHPWLRDSYIADQVLVENSRYHVPRVINRASQFHR